LNFLYIQTNRTGMIILHLKHLFLIQAFGYNFVE